jgi:hypothetical protein
MDGRAECRAALEMSDLEKVDKIGRGIRPRMRKCDTMVFAGGLWLVGFASQP